VETRNGLVARALSRDSVRRRGTLSNMCSMQLMSRTDADAESIDRSLDDLERDICELGAHIEAATCTWLLLLAEFDEREGWGVWGARSCAQWLSWRCSLAPGAARERVRVARCLKELPLARAAFSAGELSYCKIRALTRIATPEIEEQLVELARHATGAQIEKLVRGYSGALAATVDQAQRAHEVRYLRWSWDEDGSLLLQGRIPAEEGALLIAALGEAEDSAVADEPAAAPRADALMSVVRSAHAAPDAARRGGDRCELIVHVDAATLASDEVSERSEVENGPAISPETARRLGCDAAVVRILERDGKPRRWGVERGQSRRRSAGRSDRGTTDAGFQAARTGDSCMPTTSSIGLAEARRTWTTWCSCVHITTVSCTRAAFRSSARGPGDFAFAGQTAAWSGTRPRALRSEAQRSSNATCGGAWISTPTP
jgi:uncharacterized protein DUF222